MEQLLVLCINDNGFTGLVPETITLLTNLEMLTVQLNHFVVRYILSSVFFYCYLLSASTFSQIDPHWLLEYIPEDCEFEADEDEICSCISDYFCKKKLDLTEDELIEMGLKV